MVGLVNWTARGKPALGGISLKMNGPPDAATFARELEAAAPFEVACEDWPIGIDAEPVMVAWRFVKGSWSALSTL